MSIKKIYGLIGKNIDYSFSKKYFSRKFQDLRIEDSIYLNYDLDQIKDFNNIDFTHIRGLNVTIPYKEKIIKFLDDTEGSAKEIGAVNTISIKNNKLIGHNTDYKGFINSFENNLCYKKALIIGSGGASKAVQYGLDLNKIKFDVVSRKYNTDYKTYEQINLSEYDLIINTSPLGTFPNTNEKPNINYDQINNKQTCYDLIYNPTKTLFLIEAEKKGALIMNGLNMLKNQAEESWIIWNK
tara:strand:+ start:1807 stop:2526 length:720 start_codon:yes stop_codon:yes gene_type:complete